MACRKDTANLKMLLKFLSGVSQVLSGLYLAPKIKVLKCVKEQFKSATPQVAPAES